jgi:hypothetical protein
VERRRVETSGVEPRKEPCVAVTDGWISVLLAVVGVGFLVGYAVPLLVAPFVWARRFGWVVPEERHLALYLGRCVGGLALVITFLSLRAAFAPRAHVEAIELLIGTGMIMTLVHVVGALQRVQPIAETVEIILYGVLTILLCLARAHLSP